LHFTPSKHLKPKIYAFYNFPELQKTEFLHFTISQTQNLPPFFSKTLKNPPLHTNSFQKIVYIREITPKIIDCMSISEKTHDRLQKSTRERLVNAEKCTFFHKTLDKKGSSRFCRFFVVAWFVGVERKLCNS
jgi:hypothetical protein